MNHGRNLPAQSMDEMIESSRQQRQSSKLYKAQSAEFSEMRISELISRTAAQLADAATKEPVSLTDTDEVKRRTILYLKACEAACFPSINGLALSMGLTRQALYDVIWRHNPAATADWLELCRDSFSDILADASLKNDCNNITAIFLQKALYGLRETVEIVAKSENPVEEEINPEVLAERIAGSVVDDMEDDI